MRASSIFTIANARTHGHHYSNKPPYAERHVRWCERTGSHLMATFLLDLWIYTNYTYSIVLRRGGSLSLHCTMNLLCRHYTRLFFGLKIIYIWYKRIKSPPVFIYSQPADFVSFPVLLSTPQCCSSPYIALRKALNKT